MMILILLYNHSLRNFVLSLFNFTPWILHSLNTTERDRDREIDREREIEIEIDRDREREREGQGEGEGEGERERERDRYPLCWSFYNYRILEETVREKWKF